MQTVKKLMAFVFAFILCIGAVPAFASFIDLSAMSDEELLQLRADIDAELSARSATPLLAGGTLLEGDLGEYHVALTDIQRATGSSNTPCVILSFLFTNNGSDAAAFTMAIAKSVYQNGVECEMALFTTPSVNGMKSLMDAMDGASIEVQSAFELHDAESPIEIELRELFNWLPNAPTLVGTFALPD